MSKQLEADAFQGVKAYYRDAILISRYLKLGDVLAVKRVLRKSQATQDCSAPIFVITYAFAIALIDRNGSVAQAWLNEVPDEARDGFPYWRAKACVLAVSGDRDGAGQAVAKARTYDAGDDDDNALFAAIEAGEPPPATFARTESP